MISDERNIYQLRIVLAPPKSYLVWTPLPEHRNRIVKFKYFSFFRSFIPIRQLHSHFTGCPTKLA